MEPSQPTLLPTWTSDKEHISALSNSDNISFLAGSSLLLQDYDVVVVDWCVVYFGAWVLAQDFQEGVFTLRLDRLQFVSCPSHTF